MVKAKAGRSARARAAIDLVRGNVTWGPAPKRWQRHLGTRAEKVPKRCQVILERVV
jgi:hypothetical protein